MTDPRSATDTRLLDEITLLARRLAGTDAALISVVDGDTDSIASCSGSACLEPHLARMIASSKPAHQQPQPVIPGQDHGSGATSGSAGLAAESFPFQASFPLVSADGLILGALAVLHGEPHRLSPQQVDSLEQLASITRRILLSLSLTQQPVDLLQPRPEHPPNPAQTGHSHLQLLTIDQLVVELERILAQDAGGFGLLRCRFRDYERVNFSLGHTTAEEFISEGFRRIGAAVPRNSSIARFSEAEFLVLLPLSGEQEAVIRIAERILAFCVQTYRHAAQVLAMSLAIGATTVSSNDASIGEVLADTSMAVRIAMRSAGSGFHFVDAGKRQLERESYRLDSELRDALNHRALIPYLQPIVDLVSGDPIGFEALARWPRGNEVLTPSSFMPQLIDAGITAELDLLIVEQALAAIPLLAQPIPLRPMWMSINHSAMLLANDNCRQRILALIDANPLPMGWTLQIELLEDAFRDTSTAIDRFLADLAERGVAIAIDDFGTGYSSLARLISLPIQVVKIDRAFVSRLEEPGESPRTLLRTMISMLKDLGLTVTAEGVESDQQRSWLLDEGVQKAQGYLFHQPLPINLAIGLLEQLEYRPDALPVDIRGGRGLGWLSQRRSWRLPFTDRRFPG